MLSKSEQLGVFGGIGAGKSYSILYKIRELMRLTPGSIWLVGRNTLKDLREDTYETCFGADGLFNGLGKFNKNTHEFQMFNNSKIYFKHFDDPAALRGPSVAGIFIEQAEMVKKDVFDTLTGRLRQWGNPKNKTSLSYRYTQKFGKSANHIHVPKHYFFMAANPDAGSWIKKEFIDKEMPGWELILTTTYDNKDNLPADYIEKLRAQHNDIWVSKFIMGSWEKAEGIVYPEFTNEHIIDPISIPQKSRIFVAIDPGYQHASVALFTTIQDGKLIVFDEVYEIQKTIPEVAAIINKKINIRFPMIKDSYDWTFLIDPSANRKEMGTAKSLKSMYVDAGIFPIDADNESRAARHVIKDLLKHGKIQVTSNCLNTIREFNCYKWHPTKPDEVVKLDDDCMDALKYIVNYQPEWKDTVAIKKFGDEPEERKLATHDYLTRVFHNATLKEDDPDYEEIQIKWKLS